MGGWAVEGSRGGVPVAPAPAALLSAPAGGPWSVEDILTEDDEQDRVPLQKLKLLGNLERLEGGWGALSGGAAPPNSSRRFIPVLRLLAWP